VTGAWAVADWFFKAEGVDLSKVQLRSSSSSAAMVAELSLKRVDAVVLNPTESSAAIVQAQSTADPLRAIGIFDADIWKRYSGTDTLPAITFGVWRNWLAKPENLDLARRFYAANLDAQKYIQANPKEAAQRISGPSKISEEALLDTFTRFGRLTNVRPLSAYRPAIKVLTQKLLPEAKLLPQPLTDAELNDYIADFKP
jgi:ABC-type nitrate/sulfonate/bicarbonate transport system substrate-binding protein